jgi:hypothetical protein
MGDASEIGCPYCSTLFRLDPSLGAHEADPADSAYDAIYDSVARNRYRWYGRREWRARWAVGEIIDMTKPNFVDCATGRSCRFLHRDLNHLAKESSSCLPA